MGVSGNKFLQGKLSDRSSRLVSELLEVNKYLNKTTSAKYGMSQTFSILGIWNVKSMSARNICNLRIWVWAGTVFKLMQRIREKNTIGDAWFTTTTPNFNKNVRVQIIINFSLIFSSVYLITCSLRTHPLCLVPLFKTWYFWVLIIVSLILKSYAIWCFFFKNEKSYQVN